MNDFENLKFMSNITNNAPTCQAVFCNEQELCSIVESFNDKERLTLDVFLRLANRYSVIYPKQATIGGFADYSRETVNRKIKEWVQLGILVKKTIYHKYCIYTIHPLFFNPEFRKKYSHLFKAFKTFALIYLFSFGLAHVYQNVTLKSPGNMFSLNRFGSVSSNVNKLTDSKRESRSPQNMYQSEARKKLIIEITNHIGLTRRGQASLAAYPAECLEYVFEKMKTVPRSQIRNAWNWFISLCNQYCKDNDIRPDFKQENDIIAQYNLKQNGPKIDPNFVPPVASVKSEPVRSGYQKRDNQSQRSRGHETEAQFVYRDSALSMQDSRNLKIHNDRKKIQAALNRGDMEEVVCLKKWSWEEPTTITKENQSEYQAAVAYNRSAPVSFKEEWKKNPEKVPTYMADVIAQVIQEYNDGIVISSPDNIITELSKKISLREQLGQIDDYSNLQEEFSAEFL